MCEDKGFSENTQVSPEAKETEPRTPTKKSLNRNKDENIYISIYTYRYIYIAAPPAQDSTVVIVQTTFFDDRQNSDL